MSLESSLKISRVFQYMPHGSSKLLSPERELLRTERKILTPPNRAKLNPNPYPHAFIHKFCDKDALLSVRAELHALQTTYKETDLFKVYQTGDLANIDTDNPAHQKAMKNTIQLRAALYSAAFRKFVQKLTGCEHLIDKTDMSCNVYKQGGHLLCHDDVIGTRCVSYIIYLSRPEKKWQPSDGGALELYELDSEGVPRDAPSLCLPPEFGALVLFAVVPGQSFHSVAEVLSSTDRLSISGWFHARQPPPEAETMASLAQLKRSFPPQPFKRIKVSSAAVNVFENLKGLANLVNSSYLEPLTIQAIRRQLKTEGAVQLASFLRPDAFKKILRAAAAADLSAGFGSGRPSGPPTYSVGIEGSWVLVGPPHLQRYCRYETPRNQNGDAAQAGRLLWKLRSAFLSEIFTTFIRLISGRKLRASRAEVRRFRPGHDYTLAHAGQLNKQTLLDMTFCCVPLTRNGAAEALQMWDSGDVGGFECLLERDESSGAAEVYNVDSDQGGVTSIHAANNTLNLTLRQPDTMKFVKYVSAAAPCSRWDVAVEYKLGQARKGANKSERRPIKS